MADKSHFSPICGGVDVFVQNPLEVDASAGDNAVEECEPVKRDLVRVVAWQNGGVDEM